MPSINSAFLFDVDFLKLLAKAPLTDLCQAAQGLWPAKPLSLGTDKAAVCKAFAQHLKSEISLVHNHRRMFGPHTLDSMTDAVGSMRQTPSDTLGDMITKQRSESMNVDDLATQRALEMSVRIALTINVNSSDMAVGGVAFYEQPLDWYREESVLDLVNKAFPTKHGLELPAEAEIDGAFAAEYLVSNCGVELEWTNYLTDHLRLDQSRRVLLVYRHKVFLKDRGGDSGGGGGGGEELIPAGVLDEALDTLNLLFPFGDLATQQLLTRHHEDGFYNLGTCGRDRVLELSRFKYWRHELETLLLVYHSPPRTWKQLAVDRRNKLEWSAFWVTVMVAVLTLVSIPCSIIQAVYSVKAYRLALAQNNAAERHEL